jgi:hypothetical protein
MMDDHAGETSIPLGDQSRSGAEVVGAVGEIR